MVKQMRWTSGGQGGSEGPQSDRNCLWQLDGVRISANWAGEGGRRVPQKWWALRARIL